MRAQTSYTPTERAKARYQVAQALKRGELKKGRCEVCRTTSVVAHHDDYSQPLNIRWFCVSHHMAHHRKLGWGATFTPPPGWVKKDRVSVSIDRTIFKRASRRAKALGLSVSEYVEGVLMRDLNRAETKTALDYQI